MEGHLDADGAPDRGAGYRAWPRVLAWSCFGAVVIMVAWGIVGSASNGPATSLGADLMWSVILVAFALVGAFIVQQRPGHRIGWLMFVPGLAAFDPVAQDVLAAPPDEVTIRVVLALWAENFSWLPVFFSVFLLLALFPTGHPVNRRWRWHTWLTLAMGVFLLGWGLFARELGPVESGWTVENPIGFLPLVEEAAWFPPAWNVGLVTITLGALAAMTVRYRRSGAVERQQLKWLLYAVTLFSLVYVSIVFFQDWTANVVIDVLLAVALLFIPVAIMIAIVRHRLFDIDVIIRRTVVYGIVAVLLAATYAGLVVGFEALVRDVADIDSSVGVAASTLLVVMLFAPVRRRTQAFVARRFFRSTYNAEIVAAAFGARARLVTDASRLSDDLVGVVEQVLQPRSVGLWLPRRSTPPPPGR